MKYYPVFMEMKGRSCLVVGGGSVGARKAGGLSRAGAIVTVVSSLFSKDTKWPARVNLQEKNYEKADMQGMFFVFAATDKAGLNQQIAEDAAELGILCNVADAPGSSDFLLPSTIARGDLMIAVSTSGASPAMARIIKQELTGQFGPEYGTLLDLMGNVRKKILAGGHAPDAHKKMFYQLIEKDILSLIKDEDEDGIDSVLNDVLGPGYRFRELVAAKE